MKFRQAFFLGQQRSGSNLLRLILNNSSEVTAPHPPHILPRFHSIVPKYGDLEMDENFNRVVKDVCKMVDLNPVRWNNYPQNPERVFNNAEDRSLIGIHESLMNIYAEAEEVNFWICKSKNNVDFVDDILDYYKNPKFVYLVRDPRDVALSFMETFIGRKHAYFLGQEWAIIQQKCFDVIDTLGPGVVFQLRYEDLISEPENAVARLCEFLDINYEPTMLEYYMSSDASKTASVSQQWENVSQPILRSNVGKYKSKMKQEDVAIIEHLCRDEMIRLGYDLENFPLYEPINPTVVNRYQQVENEKIQLLMNSYGKEEIESRKAQDLWIKNLAFDA